MLSKFAQTDIKKADSVGQNLPAFLSPSLPWLCQGTEHQSLPTPKQNSVLQLLPGGQERLPEDAAGAEAAHRPRC